MIAVLRVATDVVQHRTVNLLKALQDFFFFFFAAAAVVGWGVGGNYIVERRLCR